MDQPIKSSAGINGDQCNDNIALKFKTTCCNVIIIVLNYYNKNIMHSLYL